MSSDYTVFTAADPIAVRELVEDLLRVTLDPPSDPELRALGVLHAEFLGIWITYEPQHDMEDEPNLKFSHEPVAVTFTRTGLAGDADLREPLCRALSCLVRRRIVLELGERARVVLNCGRVIEG